MTTQITQKTSYRSKIASSLLVFGISLALLNPIEGRAGHKLDYVVSAIGGIAGGASVFALIHSSTGSPALASSCGSLFAAAVSAGTYCFSRSIRQQIPLNDEENPLIADHQDPVVRAKGEEIPTSAEAFIQQHRLNLIFSQGKISVYSPYPIEALKQETLDQAQTLTTQLEKTFSGDDECPICLIDWKDLATPETQETILSWNSCECPYFYCVDCSARLSNPSLLNAHPCPHCRKPAFHRNLIFVIEDNRRIRSQLE